MPVGTIKEGFYDRGKLNISKTGMPSIWKVLLDFGKYNSDRGYFYYGAVAKDSKEFIEVLPLQDINGSLVVVHIKSGDWMEKGAKYLTDKMTEMFSFNSNIPVDCVLLQNTLQSAEYKYFMGYKHIAEHRPLIFYRSYNGVTEGKTLKFTQFSDNEMTAYMLPYFDALYLTAPHLKKAYTMMLREYLSFSSLKKVTDKIVEIPHGIADVPPASFERGKVLGYFGRLNETNKNVSKIFDAFDKLYKAGIANEVLLTSPMESDLYKSSLNLLPYAQLKIMRSEYLNEASKARATVAYYESIACPVAMIEQMACGVIPVVPKGKMWAEEFFKASFPNYPFMFRSHDEMYAMLKNILEDDELYKEWATKLSHYAIENFKYTDKKRELFDDMLRRVNESYKPAYCFYTLDEFKSKYKFIDDIIDVVKRLGDEFSFSVFKKACSKIGMVGRGGIPILSNRGLLHLLNELGYEDEENAFEIILKRRNA